MQRKTRRRFRGQRCRHTEQEGGKALWQEQVDMAEDQKAAPRPGDRLLGSVEAFESNRLIAFHLM